MPAIPSTEVLLGCEPQVRVVIIEDGGNLVLQVFAEDPANTDIDALFFNLAEGVDASNLTIFPAYDEAIGSNGENVTGYDVTMGSLNQMNNGAQIQDSYDVRLEFGTVPYSSGGDVDQAALTFFVDGGASNLTADSIDIAGATAVINSDDGQSGLALTGPGATGTPTQTPVLVTTVSESFDAVHEPDDSAAIVSDDHWEVRHNQLFTNGSNDGTLLFDTVSTEGPVEFLFDAHAENLHAFENGGHYGDSLRVEVQIDGGQWVLLDEFTVNDHNSALVGSNTGQQITQSEGQITYTVDAPEGTDSDVQFRIVSDISAHDEIIRIDDVEIRTTELVTEGATETQSVENDVLTETFDSTWNTSAGHAPSVEGHTDWDMRHGELQTDGHDDGWIAFEPVSVNGPASIEIDARVPNPQYFESGGCYGDSLEMWALVNGSDWVHLDTFTVNHAGTALVGDTTGQEITATTSTLSYEGGALDDADSVQFYMGSHISAGNEEIYFDNLTISETVEIEVPVDGSGDRTCEDFDTAQAGDVAATQFDGVTVSAQRAGDDASSENDAMIFDTENPTGGDHDLEYSDQGNVIVISEDNDSTDPDDNAHGGTITFEFDEPSTVDSLTVLDIEEDGGTIDLFDADGVLLTSIGIPAAGDNSAQDIAIDTAGVATMNVTLAGSGAVDDLCYTPASEDCGQYDVSYDELIYAAWEDEQQDSQDDQTSDDEMMMV